MLAAVLVAVAITLSWGSLAQAVTVTSTGESGGCTLKGAIAAAAANNNNTPCGDVVQNGQTPINLPANTYTLSSGQIVVPQGAFIKIIGANINNPLTTVIDGTSNLPWRVFEIKSGATVEMSGLTVTGGRSPAGQTPATRFEAWPGDFGGGILNQGSLTLDHVVITGNRAGNGSDGLNGGLEQAAGGGGEGGRGGGIYNADNATLTITNSEISDNIAGNGGNGGDGGEGLNALGHNPDGRAGGNGGPGGSGGGIYNSNFGNLTIDRTTISGNRSGRGGAGGAGAQGAGPAPIPGNTSGGEFSGGRGGDGGDGGNNGKQYRKDQGTFWDDARGGGGVYNLGYMTLTNSTVSGNSTGAGGLGGPSGAGGKINSTSNNFNTSGRAGTGGGGGRGGGLLNGSWQQGRMWLTNVTITGNTTGDGGTGGGGGGGATSTLGGGKGGYGGDGGGIWGQGAHNNETLLTHVTITRNFIGGAGLSGSSAGTSNGGPGEKGRGAGLASGSRYNPSGAGVYLRKSLVAGNGFPTNGDDQCFDQVGTPAGIIDQGYSLTWNGTSCPAAVNADPDLGNLGNYGGPTETIVPQPGSPAIGGVPLAQCDINSDQRGFPRPGPDGTSCDIGAVETGVGPSTTPTTTSLSSSLNPSRTGQQVTYTATVAPPPSSGTISFRDGGVIIPGCEALSHSGSGQVTCSVTYPVIGDHSIVASYTGNSLFDPSMSSTLTQIVNNGTIPDTTPPDTIIDSGPSGTIFEDSATFTFHGTPGDTARTQCRMDTGDFAECPSPKTYSGLSDGTHVFSVRAVDAVGNQDASPATRTFRVETGDGEPAKTTAGKPSKSGTAVTVPFTCSGPAGLSCVIKANLSTLVPGAGSSSTSSLHTSGKRKKVTVGAAKASIAAGTTKKVSIRLNGKGRKLLKKARKIKTTLTVTQLVDTDYRKVLARSITFKSRK